MPSVTVIIPAFNAEAFIGEALQSLQSQSFKDFEGIVIDDGSADGTVAIAQAAAGADARLRVLVQPRNMGGPSAINRAIDEARGDWITVLDSDDAFFPDRLHYLLELAKRWEADLCADNLCLTEVGTAQPLGVCLDERRLPRETLISFTDFLKLDALDPYGRSRMGVGYFKPLINKEFLDQNHIRYRTDLTSNYDGLFHAECLLAGARYALSPEARYNYFVARPGSIGATSRGLRSVTNRTLRNRILIEHPNLDRFPGARELLVEQSATLARAKAYIETTQALSDGDYSVAARRMGQHLTYLPYFVARFGHAVMRRLLSGHH
ncbi:glycosyltransferase family 2 protein [Methylolobus aquaticus]